MRISGSALAGLAMLSLALAGCGKIAPMHHLPPQVAPGGCDEIITFGARLPLPASPLEGPPQPGAEEAWQTDPRSDPVGLKLLDALGQAPVYAEGVVSGVPPVSESVLILSGGSQQGAFGAGFMDAWAKARGGSLPRFKLVTGISTGALQATFAFLGDTKTIVEEYSIEAEGELLTPLVTGRFELKPVRAGISLTRAGTIARLEPLRERLGDLISDKLLTDVAREATEYKRTLLVGAVEIGSGEMAVFDLTKAAALYVQNRHSDPARAERLRGCYIEALLASSSVPMSADPVFIDNRLYIDGGARFGVLVDLTANAFRQTVAEAMALARAADVPRNLFLIVNATLEVPAFCGLAKCEVGNEGQPIKTPPGTPHPKWTFLQLAQRTVSVMTNQAYRSSVFIADQQRSTREFKTRFVRLDPDHLRFSTALDFPGAGPEPKICYQWQRDDEAIDHPKEFFPRYMRCLIAYGRQHPEAARFAEAEPL